MNIFTLNRVEYRFLFPDPGGSEKGIVFREGGEWYNLALMPMLIKYLKETALEGVQPVIVTEATFDFFDLDFHNECVAIAKEEGVFFWVDHSRNTPKSRGRLGLRKYTEDGKPMKPSDDPYKNDWTDSLAIEYYFRHGGEVYHANKVTSKNIDKGPVNNLLRDWRRKFCIEKDLSVSCVKKKISGRVLNYIAGEKPSLLGEEEIQCFLGEKGMLSDTVVAAIAAVCKTSTSIREAKNVINNNTHCNRHGSQLAETLINTSVKRLGKMERGLSLVRHAAKLLVKPIFEIIESYPEIFDTPESLSVRELYSSLKGVKPVKAPPEYPKSKKLKEGELEQKFLAATEQVNRTFLTATELATCHSIQDQTATISSNECNSGCTLDGVQPSRGTVEETFFDF